MLSELLKTSLIIFCFCSEISSPDSSVEPVIRRNVAGLNSCVLLFFNSLYVLPVL